MDAGPTLFDLPPGPMLAAVDALSLRKLEGARPFGLTRVRGGWAGLGHVISLKNASRITASGFARIDRTGRHPRLRITKAGRTALGIAPVDAAQQ